VLNLDTSEFIQHEVVTCSLSINSVINCSVEPLNMMRGLICVQCKYIVNCKTLNTTGIKNILISSIINMKLCEFLYLVECVMLPLLIVSVVLSYS